MEGRALPTNTTTLDDDPLGQTPLPPPPVFSQRPPLSRKTSSLPLSPVHDPSLTLPIQSSETYIIQIPKNQIFRSPPPENAIFVQRYHETEKKKKRSSCCCCRFCWCLFVFFIVLGLLIGLGVFLFHHKFFSPEAPLFSIVDIDVVNNTHSKKPNFDYEFKITSKNPNSKMGIYYQGNIGDATLSYKGSNIGIGKFPELDQDPGISSNFGLSLDRPNGALPTAIEASIEDKKGKTQTALLLNMKNVPVSYKILGALKLWSKVIDVDCDIKVSSLGASHVMSQNCQTNFKE